MTTPTLSTLDAPTLDSRELCWAADEVAALVRQCEPNSVVCTVLEQTLRELKSLKQSALGMLNSRAA